MGLTHPTAAMLVYTGPLGDNLTCVFVDHGLLRQNEAEQVVETFGENSDVPLIHVDSKGRFLDKLADVTDPEAKRKIIGEEFIRTFEEEAGHIEDAQVSRAGDSVLGRDRERHAKRRPDKEPPQRRWSCRR